MTRTYTKITLRRFFLWLWGDRRGAATLCCVLSWHWLQWKREQGVISVQTRGNGKYSAVATADPTSSAPTFDPSRGVLIETFLLAHSTCLVPLAGHTFLYDTDYRTGRRIVCLSYRHTPECLAQTQRLPRLSSTKLGILPLMPPRSAPPGLSLLPLIRPCGERCLRSKILCCVRAYLDCYLPVATCQRCHGVAGHSRSAVSSGIANSSTTNVEKTHGSSRADDPRAPAAAAAEPYPSCRCPYAASGCCCHLIYTGPCSYPLCPPAPALAFH